MVAIAVAAMAASVAFLKALDAAASEIISSSAVVGEALLVKPVIVKSLGAALEPVLLPFSVHAAILARPALVTLDAATLAAFVDVAGLSSSNPTLFRRIRHSAPLPGMSPATKARPPSFVIVNAGEPLTLIVGVVVALAAVARNPTSCPCDIADGTGDNVSVITSAVPPAIAQFILLF